MNRRIHPVLTIMLVVVLGPATAQARYLNPNTGRFQTMDSYEGSNQDPLSLHKYLYCHANPINNIDPAGAAVYKVKHKSSFPLIDHRIIVGDTGTNYSASCYVLEFWGNDGVLFGSKWEPVKNAAWHYNVFPVSALEKAKDVITKAGHGQIVATLVTSVDVDRKLNEQASWLGGKESTWIMFFQDCGTGANAWLDKSLRQQRMMHPYTLGHNYMNLTLDLGVIPGI